MQKFLPLVLIAGLFVSGVPFHMHAYGQTNNAASIQNLLNVIQQLNSQIQSLQKQVAELQKKQQEVQQQKKEAVFEFISRLTLGSQGENVEALQALLAADTEIYPEALITGYFGALTEKAVKKFQKKYGIEQAGVVGPKTIKELNKLLKKHPIAFEVQAEDGDDEDDDDDEDSGPGRGHGRAVCAIVPPGHLIAPGWLKKHGGVRPVVPACQILPPGILRLLAGATSTPTSTPDTTAPSISSIAVSASTNSAVITWTTNEPADSQIMYGTSTEYGQQTTLNATLVTSHSQTITGLASGTTHHFQVKSTDAAGNLAASSDQTFTTLAIDVTAPVISSIAATNVSSTSATVTWTTDETATSKVYYSLTTPVDLGTSSSTSDSSLVTSHSLDLTGLTATSTYYFVVESADSSGNTATSSENSFATLE